MGVQKSQTVRFTTLGVAFAAASLSAAALVAHAAPETIRWEVDASRGYSPDVVQFTLTAVTPGGRNVTSSPASLNVLVGLGADQLQGDGDRPVAFHVQRD